LHEFPNLPWLHVALRISLILTLDRFIRRYKRIPIHAITRSEDNEEAANHAVAIPYAPGTVVKDEQAEDYDHGEEGHYYGVEG
jgi:hypothetical protein